jgi:DeoR family ulaG and ulaABCDEF operon transcriptional repressor
MHATERETIILDAMKRTGFVSYRELEALLDTSPATIRRDLARLDEQGSITRVHGGAKLRQSSNAEQPARLAGIPFSESIVQNIESKRAIGKVAAGLCEPGEAIMIDGGSTTLQMCPHIADLNLQVLTNSLHIVNALLSQEGTRIHVPSGAVFREQNIILAPEGEQSMPRFHAPKLFMGAASIGPQGVMQADVVLVGAERRLIEKSEMIIMLVDSSKFSGSSGAIVCGLDMIDVLVTDAGIPDVARAMLDKAGVKVMLAN